MVSAAALVRASIALALAAASTLEELRDLEARLGHVERQLGELQLENRDLRAKLQEATSASTTAALPSNTPDAQRKLTSSSRASITYDGSQVTIDADVQTANLAVAGNAVVSGSLSSHTVGFQAVPNNLVITGTNPNVEVTGYSTTLGYNVNSFGSPAFDATTGRFTVPVTGYYSCQTILRINGISSTGYLRVNIAKNGPSLTNDGLRSLSGDGSIQYKEYDYSHSQGGFICAEANDYISLVINELPNDVTISADDSSFGCHLVAIGSSC